MSENPNRSGGPDNQDRSDRPDDPNKLGAWWTRQSWQPKRTGPSKFWNSSKFGQVDIDRNLEKFGLICTSRNLAECDWVGSDLNLAKLDWVYISQNLAKFGRVNSIKIWPNLNILRLQLYLLNLILKIILNKYY